MPSPLFFVWPLCVNVLFNSGRNRTKWKWWQMQDEKRKKNKNTRAWQDKRRIERTLSRHIPVRTGPYSVLESRLDRMRQDYLSNIRHSISSFLSSLALFGFFYLWTDFQWSQICFCFSPFFPIREKNIHFPLNWRVLLSRGDGLKSECDVG